MNNTAFNSIMYTVVACLAFHDMSGFILHFKKTYAIQLSLPQSDWHNRKTYLINLESTFTDEYYISTYNNMIDRNIASRSIQFKFGIQKELK